MPAASKAYAAELDNRLQHFFSEQAAGYDVPPAVVYRIEGFIEAGILLELCTEAAVRDRLVELAEQFSGQRLADIYRQDFHLILHMRMREAPVYPSTKADSNS
jgi:hypothetical protein